MKPFTLTVAAVAVAGIAGFAAFTFLNMDHGAHKGHMKDQPHAHSNAMPEGISQTFGPLELSNGFAFATLPNQPVGGAFVSITNTGSTDDRLIAASSDLSERMEIHTMSMTDGVMEMRELPDGLAVAAGETVTMQPGGYHLMLMGLKGPLAADQTAQVTLTFETAGNVTLNLPIHTRKRDAHQGH